MFGETSLILPLLRERKRTPGARRALAAIAVAWLSLALQPCAVAAAHDGNCPRCPDGTGHDAASHHSASKAPDDAVAPCAVDAFDCARGDAYSHDARGGKMPLKDVQRHGSGDGYDGGSGFGAVAALDTARMHPGMLRGPMPAAVRRESMDPRAAPSRTVLFCVYLK